MKHFNLNIHQSAETIDQAEIQSACDLALQKLAALSPADTVNGNMEIDHGGTRILLNLTTDPTNPASA